MLAKLIEGKVMVPMRAEGPNGMIGDGMVPLSAAETVDQLSSAWNEIARLRDRAALLESLLYESLRHGYLRDDASPTWVAEARRATDRTK